MKRAMYLVLGIAGCGSFGTAPTPMPDAGMADGGGLSGAADASVTKPLTCASPALAFAVRDGALTNVGSAVTGAAAKTTPADGFPKFESNVGPVGDWAPSADEAIDFGSTPASSGIRALDFPDHAVAAAMQGSTLTITGWIQLLDTSSGSGGNRIISNFRRADDENVGLELVQTGTTLALGVNAYNDDGEFKLAPHSGAVLTRASWQFFAVTYDAGNDNGNVQFFFGSPSTQAALESDASYPRGAVSVDPDVILAIGNFSVSDDAGVRDASGEDSRVPRAKLFGLRVFSQVLTADEIACEQKRTR